MSLPECLFHDVTPSGFLAAGKGCLSNQVGYAIISRAHLHTCTFRCAILVFCFMKSGSMKHFFSIPFAVLVGVTLSCTWISCGDAASSRPAASGADSLTVSADQAFQPKMERQGPVSFVEGNECVFYYPSEEELAQREAAEPDIRKRLAEQEALFNQLQPELSATIPMYRTDAADIKISVSANQVRLISRSKMPEPFGMLIYANGRDIKLVRRDLTADIVRAEIGAYITP